MKIIVVNDYLEMSAEAANIFNMTIKNNPNAILGLATGGTPEGMYQIMIDANKKGYTDWTNVTTFNLDEYVGIPKSHRMSYHTYMNSNLFQHVNVKKENTFLPNNDGDVNKNGEEYDKLIEEKGGIDLQILGIGENAHIAFNEPGSKEKDGTREVQLTESTIKANARYFESPSDVPRTAITMGIGSIMKAKKIVLIASGPKKAQAIYDTIKGKVTEDVPSSFLKNHPDVTIIVDSEAAKLIKSNVEK